jgi:hypothetical protein
MRNHFLHYSSAVSIEQIRRRAEKKKMKWILICLLILCCGFASDILALRCASSDGLSVEDVRKGRKAGGKL